MKLFMIVFSTDKTIKTGVYSYVDTSMQSKIMHYSADGFPVVKETDNCWFLEAYPIGLPRQYRKADEYKLINNSRGIYMFGRDSEKLVKKWSGAASA